MHVESPAVALAKRLARIERLTAELATALEDSARARALADRIQCEAADARTELRVKRGCNLDF